MELRGKSAALYGRFSANARERLVGEIAARGGLVARDLTRRSDIFVVGALAWPLIAAGHLGARLTAARERGVPIFSERRFAEALQRGDGDHQTSVPVAAIVIRGGLTQDEVEVLSAFDIIRVEAGHCRFSDAEPLKAAEAFIAGERSLVETVRILTAARDRAPRGRRKIVLDSQGQAALEWESGLTNLDGQGFLPLEQSSPTIEDVFEAAAASEAAGELDEAARLYEIGARIDKKDPIACFNLGNIKLTSGVFGEAALAFRQALAREAAFVEARYNLAQAYEGAGKLELARNELVSALEIEPSYEDARFNLAQLELKRGALPEAKAHFELYLAANPPADWAEKARRAIQYCSAQLSA